MIGFGEVAPTRNTLVAVYVDPAAGGLGAGGALLAACEDTARAAGCPTLELDASLQRRACDATMARVDRAAARPELGSHDGVRDDGEVALTRIPRVAVRNPGRSYTRTCCHRPGTCTCR